MSTTVRLSALPVGIVGLGAIGRAVCRRAHGFNMEIRYATPRPLPTAQEEALGVTHSSLGALMSWADVISV